MKNILIYTLMFYFFLIECPSSYGITKLSSKEKYYNKFNLSGIKFTNDSSSARVSKETAHNIFYGEFWGNGGSFSFNYEREIFLNFNIRVGIGIVIGASVSNTGKHSEAGGDIFGMLNYLIEIHSNNYIEVGAGLLTQGTKDLPTISLGYRYSPFYGGFFFKLTFDMKPNVENKFIPWGGLGIGVRF
jgi:hypothetical protein